MISFSTGCSRATGSNCLKVKVKDITRHGKKDIKETVTDNVVIEKFFRDSHVYFCEIVTLVIFFIRNKPNTHVKTFRYESN